jgi:hypothetical protein
LSIPEVLVGPGAWPAALRTRLAGGKTSTNAQSLHRTYDGRSFSDTMPIAPLPGPQGLYSVSVMPRFLLDSSRVGWQGAYFTDILGAREGIVDHGHQRYCIRRGQHREACRALGRRTWQEMPVGFSV